MRRGVTLYTFLVAVSLITACAVSAPQSDSWAPTTGRGTVLQNEKQVWAFQQDGVYFSNQPDGARLDSVERIDRHDYLLYVSPGAVPVNSSPYFAFQVWSDDPTEITVNLRYREHKHRYIPKFSSDGINWAQVRGVITSDDDTLITFDLAIDHSVSWLSAQEVISSSDTYEWLDELVDTREYLEKSVIGQSVQGRPLYVASIENESIKNSAVLVARQHPPEIPGGAIAFMAFFEELISDSELALEFRSSFNTYAFPLANPDGADMGLWRHNANGQDLNRDWIEFSQPETRAIRDFINNKIMHEDKNIIFGIDFHTSRTGPYLLIFQPENEKSVATNIIPNWLEFSRGSRTEITRYNRRDQTLPYCYNWFYQAFGVEAVTYEEADETDRDIVRERAQTYARSWMRAMLGQVGTNQS